MGAWQGDWEGRILGSIRASGHDGVWSYLRANPGVSLRAIAERIGDVAPVQIQGLAVAECLRRREMGELICDLMARSVRSNLPRGWGEGQASSHARAVSLALLVPEPYRTACTQMGIDLFRSSPPPAGWLPASGEDPVLRAAWQRALAGLPDERRRVVEQGEVEKQPGDAYSAALQPVWRTLRLRDGADFVRELHALRPELRHLYAVHCCDSEIRNGGFHQFYSNSTGILAPEAAEGFDAIGLPECAALVRRTISFFDDPFPRERVRRQAKLPRGPAKRAEWDPFDRLDREYYVLTGEGAQKLCTAADTYVDRHALRSSTQGGR